MTRFTHFATGCSAFALAGFVTVGAQTPQTSPSTMQQNSRQEVTAVGCLKADSTMGSMGSQTGSTTGSQTGAASATSAAGRYKLEDAKITASGSASGSMSGQSATGSSATGSTATGTTGSATEMDRDKKDMDKKDMDIALMPATSSVNLSEHLNHQVEVRGSWDMSAASSMGSTGSTTGSTGATTGSTGSTGSSTMGSDRAHTAKSLRVTSVRMVSSTCS